MPTVRRCRGGGALWRACSEGWGWYTINSSLAFISQNSVNTDFASKLRTQSGTCRREPAPSFWRWTFRNLMLSLLDCTASINRTAMPAAVLRFSSLRTWSKALKDGGIPQDTFSPSVPTLSAAIRCAELRKRELHTSLNIKQLSASTRKNRALAPSSFRASCTTCTRCL